jgi:lambda repressor-like predicted transcriptional regulator
MGGLRPAGVSRDHDTHRLEREVRPEQWIGNRASQALTCDPEAIWSGQIAELQFRPEIDEARAGR